MHTFWLITSEKFLLLTEYTKFRIFLHFRSVSKLSKYATLYWWTLKLLYQQSLNSLTSKLLNLAIFLIRVHKSANDFDLQVFKGSNFERRIVNFFDLNFSLSLFNLNYCLLKSWIICRSCSLRITEVIKFFF